MHPCPVELTEGLLTPPCEICTERGSGEQKQRNNTPSKFRGDAFSSFYVVLLTNQPTQDTTYLVVVKHFVRECQRLILFLSPCLHNIKKPAFFVWGSSQCSCKLHRLDTGDVCAVLQQGVTSHVSFWGSRRQVRQFTLDAWDKPVKRGCCLLAAINL